VLHRDNLDHVAEIIALAERLKADRLELANTQYLGWALINRRALLPTREQLEGARAVAAEARKRLRGRMEVLFVTPDYYSDFPKSCMDGWGRRFIVVSPDGLVLPCHAAHTLPGLTFENVRERSLGAIWSGSAGFNAFRGEAWMPEPCRSCDRRGVDFGGCRCQAYHLTGDAAATDPTCTRRSRRRRTAVSLPLDQDCRNAVRRRAQAGSRCRSSQYAQGPKISSAMIPRIATAFSLGGGEDQGPGM
jgi:PqqA peptide cyclase